MTGEGKVAKVLHEFTHGQLHTGSKHGPRVTSRKQAIAIALSEARQAGARIPQRRGTGGAGGSPNKFRRREGGLGDLRTYDNWQDSGGH